MRRHNYWYSRHSKENIEIRGTTLSENLNEMEKFLEKINLLQVIQNEIGNWKNPTHFRWVKSAVKIFSQDRRNLVVWKLIFRMINDIHGLVIYMSHLFERQFINVTNQKQNFSFFLSTPLSSVQLFSHVQLFATPWTAAHQASLSITNSWSLLKLMFIESVMPSNHLILCYLLLLLPSIFPSIRVFSNKSVLCIRWPKYWSFSFSISPSNEYSGLISFRMDGLDLLAVQGTLKSLLQHHSSNASILRCSVFFIVQLSHLYMTTGKTLLTLLSRGPLTVSILQP